MPGRARRSAFLLWPGHARRAGLAAGLWLAALAPAHAAPVITAAAYADPTDRYDHGVLGDRIEHATLVLTLDGGSERRFSLPDTMVFEDTAPRLADITGDGNRLVDSFQAGSDNVYRLRLDGVDNTEHSIRQYGPGNTASQVVGAGMTPASIEQYGGAEISIIRR